MTRTVFTIILLVSTFAEDTGWARVGESVEACTKRYGTAAFSHDKGPFSYRIFHFSHRTIKAYYYNDRSVMELIAPEQINYLSKEQANELIKEEMKFYMGLLQGAYGFTDVELKDALKLNMTKPDVLEASVSHGSITAGFEANIQEAERTIDITIAVGGGDEIKNAMDDQAFAERFSQFRLEAITAADKSSKRKAAEGF